MNISFTRAHMLRIRVFLSLNGNTLFANSEDSLGTYQMDMRRVYLREKIID